MSVRNDISDISARAVVARIDVPVVFRGYVNNWSFCEWTVEKWNEIFGDREIPFRCVNKKIQSDEPCWERLCTIKNMTFKQFVEAAYSSDEAMYFDYKYLHEWFSGDNELCKKISWDKFGYPGKGPIDTTLWIGSGGSHTPAHQDTYGVNIVTQVHGKKRWILLPPESDAMQPTRVPYEESSIYSGLNFYRPISLEVFKNLTEARVVDLSAGDALVVPHKWWHYVQNEDPINISLNMWLPHEADNASRVCEAAIKIFVAQYCKTLPQEAVKLIVNPNEIDIIETPEKELLALIEASRRCSCSAKKRRKICESDAPTAISGDGDNFKGLFDNPDNKMELVPIVTNKELVKLIEETKNKYENTLELANDDEINARIISLAKTHINKFCLDEGDVVQRLYEFMGLS